MGLTRVSPFLLCILIKPRWHRASCRLHYFPRFIHPHLLASDHLSASWISKFTVMVGPGDQLDPSIPTLFALRLVTVRFQILPVLHFPDQITTGRILKVDSAIGGTIEFFWLSPQSWPVRCLLGTTSLPSEWRSISFGNPSGTSWRGCTSFNVTWPLFFPFRWSPIVSPMCFLSSSSHLFFRSNGGQSEEHRVSEGVHC